MDEPIHNKSPEHPTATLSSRATWRAGMAFDASVDGFGLGLDAGPEVGGTGHGPRPKALVLTALAGCTAMDVVAILKKMRVTYDALTVSAEGALSHDHPKVFTTIELSYDFVGHDLPLDKLERAAKLSLDSYCGVAAMLRPAAHIRHTIRVNGAPRLRVGDTTIRYTPEVSGPSAK